MTDKRQNPLRVEPPVRRADDALGERLALLARASVPTPVRRRAAWRVPLGGLAIVVATGGLAYGAQSVVQHIDSPAGVVPGGDLSPSRAASNEASGSPRTDVSGTSSAKVLQPGATPSTHRPALATGKGHPKGPQDAPGHSGTAPGKSPTQQRGKSSTAPGKGLVNQAGANSKHAGSTRHTPKPKPTPRSKANGRGQGG